MGAVSIRITPTMVHSIDTEGRIAEVSDLWLTTLGYTWDEVIGRLSTDFLSDESARYARDVVLPTFFATGACEVEYDMKRRDGVLLPVRLRGVAVRSENGTFLRSIAVIEDLTERRALERKMFEAQKLESLALMAGNIAHDFNNLLASVMGNAQLSLRHVRDLPPVVSSLTDIMTATTRAADLCRQLLAYSGRGRFQIDTIDLDDLVSEMVKVLEVNVGKQATIELALMKRNARVTVDATQIRQILMNLVINAGEALPGHGTIKITTSRQALDEATIAASSHPDIKPGEYICLEISDTGHGMSAEVLSQIFDPFFTTKATGHGLGLAAVHGIVRGHHGTLRVHSEEARGTTFQIYLPAVDDELTQRQVEPERSTSQRGTILVADDDELLRKTLANQLTDAGYQVVLAGSSSEAMRLASPSITTFLVDVTMPGLDGARLATQLRREFSSARIVMMSGYDRVDVAQSSATSFLEKPFTHDQLLQAVDPGACRAS